MRLYLPENVLDASLNRIRRLFDEFPRVVVDISGGKDSTVVYNLALQVAAEKNRLPLDVRFVDQEAEWDCVIDHVRECLHDPRVRGHWLQVPIVISNGTSTDQPWLHCWRDGDDWIRPKEADSIHENIYGTNRFVRLFEAHGLHHWGDEPLAILCGVRAQESPARTKGLTTYPTYKDITWGRVVSRQRDHYVFHPIYDWHYEDVWKAIHDHRWPYCPLYDYMYQHGRPAHLMRVSSVHHETAIVQLTFLQEIEPDTWDRLTARISGTNAVNQAKELYKCPRDLPPMFASWREYRDHLLDTLIEPDTREIFRKQFEADDHIWQPYFMPRVIKMHIASLLVNDYHGVKNSTFGAANREHKIRGGANRDRLTNAFAYAERRAAAAVPLPPDAD